jgi:hypothetical protein
MHMATATTTSGFAIVRAKDGGDLSYWPLGSDPPEGYEKVGPEFQTELEAVTHIQKEQKGKPK